jgi:hypothetical protein
VHNPITQYEERKDGRREGDRKEKRKKKRKESRNKILGMITVSHELRQKTAILETCAIRTLRIATLIRE